MRAARLSCLVAVAIWLGASAASAGTIVSTVGGAMTTTVMPGDMVTVDTVITFGPTAPVGGVGAGIEISFTGTSIVAGGGVGPLGGASTFPAGWIDVTGGAFTCSAAGFCENVVATGVLFGGVSFGAGATFAMPSIVIDTTGAAQGSYMVRAIFSAAGPDAILASGGTNVNSEYTFSAATINVVPEPGTAALMAIGLGLLGIAGRRR